VEHVKGQESVPLGSPFSPSIARVIFVGPKKVVGRNLLFFGAIARPSEFAVVQTMGEELKLRQRGTKAE